MRGFLSMVAVGDATEAADGRSCRLLAQRAAGLAEEDVVEARLLSEIEVRLEAGAVEHAEQLRDRGLAAVDVQPDQAALAVVAPRGRTAGLDGVRTFAPPPLTPSVTTSPATCLLELVGRALGHDPAVVDDREAIGQRVGLLEVVGREEDGRPLLAELRGSRPTCALGPAGRDRSSARRGTGPAAGGRCRGRHRAGDASRRNMSE